MFDDEFNCNRRMITRKGLSPDPDLKRGAGVASVVGVLVYRKMETCPTFSIRLVKMVAKNNSKKINKRLSVSFFLL